MEPFTTTSIKALPPFWRIFPFSKVKLKPKSLFKTCTRHCLRLERGLEITFRIAHTASNNQVAHACNNLRASPSPTRQFMPTS